MTSPPSGGHGEVQGQTREKTCGRVIIGATPQPSAPEVGRSDGGGQGWVRVDQKQTRSLSVPRRGTGCPGDRGHSRRDRSCEAGGLSVTAAVTRLWSFPTAASDRERSVRKPRRGGLGGR